MPSLPTRTPRHSGPVALLALAAALGLAIQATPLQAQPTSAPCATEAHRAFDFWLGSWEVQTPDGRVAGHNTITRELDGCVLRERYETPRRYRGESLNMYDASRGVWHQTWTDNGGLLLRLEGGREGEAMVLQGETVGEDGSVTLQRISWSRIEGDPDRVRQHWESSTDGGATWSTAFDGRYHRTAEAPGG